MKLTVSPGEGVVLLLIPMALLIGIYGHGRKVYAAVKFFLYTMVASVFMLAAVIWLYAKVGSFDFVTIQNAIRAGQVGGFASAAIVLIILGRIALRLLKKVEKDAAQEGSSPSRTAVIAPEPAYVSRYEK